MDGWLDRKIKRDRYREVSFCLHISCLWQAWHPFSLLSVYRSFLLRCLPRLSLGGWCAVRASLRDSETAKPERERGI